MENERAQVRCYNCEEIGHRVRDCKYLVANLKAKTDHPQAQPLVPTSLRAATASKAVIGKTFPVSFQC
jgi:hypothetical protein